MAAQTGAAVLLASLLLALAAIASSNTEGDILYAQRQAWNDPNGVLQSWDPTLANPCYWFHVSCNNENSVARVELYENKMSGPIPATLGNLKRLISLDLYSNHLTSTIPASLGNIGSLRFLRIHRNKLAGGIPASLGCLTKLLRLELQENMLTGTVPPEVLSLVLVGELTKLNVAENNLTGTVRSSKQKVTTVIQDTFN
ncbi:hypothetical protein VPH35_047593 [Triticum aestivum]